MNIRPARYTDCAAVYAITQEPSVRAASTRSEAFAYDEHCVWWDRRFADPSQRFYVAEDGDSVAGYVRYGKVEMLASRAALDARPGHASVASNEAEIAIALLPEYRGRGYAKELLVVTEPFAVQRLDVSTLVALVLVGNVASLRLFRSCGYAEVGHEERMGKRHVRFEKSV